MLQYELPIHQSQTVYEYSHPLLHEVLQFHFHYHLLLKEQQQQFLVPPQLFNIKFLFTGKNGIEGALGSVFNKALTNIGLDFLTSEKNRFSNDKNQNENNKLFSIGDCFLKDVHVDYAPNGWAAFDDGHPVQTRVSLSFQEMNIVTKDRLATEGNTARKQSKQEKDFAKSLGDFMG